MGVADEVLNWVNEKITDWNNTQPEWWDARRKAVIPDWAVRNPDLLRSIRSDDVQEIMLSGRGMISRVSATAKPDHHRAKRRMSIVADVKRAQVEG